MNFRSRGEVLDAIDHAFEQLWGEDFEPLRERPDARAEPPRVDPPVELLVVDKHKGRWDERLADEGEDPARAGPALGHTLARARGAPARPAHRRADRRGRSLSSPRRRAAAARHDPHGLLRAGARGARRADARRRRARLLEPAAGDRPAPLAGGAGEPARRAGALLGAGLAAGRRVARRGRADRARGARDQARRLVGAARARRAARAAAGRRPAPHRALRARLRGPAPQRADGLAGDADRSRGDARPATTSTCWRCPPATGAWPTCAS